MIGPALGFWLLATLAVVAALTVVLHRNPVRSALALVAMMLVLAVLFLSLSAEFMAAVQVILYAGAVMVLILFTIMLLNLGVGESERRGLGFVAGSMIACGLAAVMLFGAVWHRGLHRLAAPVKNLRLGGTAQSVGYALFDPEMPWMLAFEIASLILLIAVVGAIVLAKRRL